MGPLTAEGTWIPVEDPNDVGRVRRAASRLADQLAFSEHRAGEVAIVASELATNLVRHASGGMVAMQVRRSGDQAGVELLAIDRGPGMADVYANMADGVSTAGTLGIGLGAVRRMSTWFDVHSVEGRGTVMLASLWPTAHPERQAHTTLTRAMRGEEVCGDSCAVRSEAGIRTYVVADGLGHGPLAQVASAEALRAIPDPASSSGPDTALEAIHRRLRPTRGAAVAVAQFDRGDRSLSFAGAGNVATWICGPNRKKKALLSAPGIVGHNVRRFRVDRVEVEDDSVLVMHSDGLTDKWDLDLPGLLTRGPEVIAGYLMRDAATRHDDASVLVARLA